MRIQRRKKILQWAAASVALPLAPRLARAQAYPARPIRLLVSFPAGGQVDIVARLTAQWLGRPPGQTIVVENKPGAGGTQAPRPSSTRRPTAGRCSSRHPRTSSPRRCSPGPYDFARDTAAITTVNSIPLVLEANPSFGPKTVAELIAVAKTKPGSISMGSPSAGTPPYLCVDLLNMMAGIKTVHVPYFGENQMVGICSAARSWSGRRHLIGNRSFQSRQSARTRGHHGGPARANAGGADGR